jgi:signal transduction histidine kinase
LEQLTLIVDDDPLALERLREHLERAGSRVASARDGHAALALARELKPDLIITDLRLPGISGFDLTAAVRQEPTLRHAPIVWTTAYYSWGEIQQAMRELGHEDTRARPFTVLRKPFQRQEIARLLKALQPALSGGRAPRFLARLHGPELLAVAQQRLARHNGVMALAPTLEAALTRLQDEPFDAAILQVLPGETGMTSAFATHLRRFPDLPVILVLEPAPQADPDPAPTAGPTMRLHQPVPASSLHLAIDNAIELAGRMRHHHATQDYMLDTLLALREAHETLSDREAELSSNNDELRRLADVKDDFLSVISHELRTPLSAIANAASILGRARAGALNEVQEHFVAILREQASRLGGLVDDLLDLQQLEAGRLSCAPAPHDAVQVIKSAAGSMGGLMEAKGVRLTVEAADSALLARFDPVRLNQVLLNLLANALKHTPAGGEVTLSAQRVADEVHLSVNDTGPGIAPADQSRIFEKFVQVGERQAGTHGTGLGLSICKRLIEEGHGGRLWVDSAQGHGSTFHVALPKG